MNRTSTLAIVFILIVGLIGFSGCKGNDEKADSDVALDVVGADEEEAANDELSEVKKYITIPDGVKATVLDISEDDPESNDIALLIEPDPDIATVMDLLLASLKADGFAVESVEHSTFQLDGDPESRESWTIEQASKETPDGVEKVQVSGRIDHEEGQDSQINDIELTLRFSNN